MELIVQQYGFTLSSQPQEDRSPVVVPASTVERLLREPIVSDDGDRIVSIRDQLSIWIQPPTLTLEDHSGAAPARTAMIETAVAAISLLADHGLDHDTYGWEVEGQVTGANPRETLRKLSNHRQVSDSLGDAAESWNIRQIDFHLRSGPMTSARAPISPQLKIEHDEDGKEELLFAANDHYHKSPDASELSEDVARMSDATRELVGRLTR